MIKFNRFSMELRCFFVKSEKYKKHIFLFTKKKVIWKYMLYYKWNLLGKGLIIQIQLVTKKCFHMTIFSTH